MRFLKYMTARSLWRSYALLELRQDEDKLGGSPGKCQHIEFRSATSVGKDHRHHADADWVAEPRLVTVTPDSGTGVTDVTISVTDNLRGGTPDNPGKKIVFGRTLAARRVLITQDGDKYRDVKEQF